MNMGDVGGQEADESGVGQPEGRTILALQPVLLEWGETLPPTGVVLQSQEISLPSRAWQYLAPRLAPVPSTWPLEAEGGVTLSVKRLVLAAGMPPPPRFGDDGWLLLTQLADVEAMSALLFNPNGVHFLVHARHRRYRRLWPARITQLQTFLASQELDAPRVVFDTCLVLELYGIRRARVIGYLALDAVSHAASPFIAQEAEVARCGIDKVEMITDARYHFGVDGFKVMAFGQLQHLKRHRRNLQDRNDLAMMAALEEGRSWYLWLGRCIDLVLVGAMIVRRAVARVARLLGLSALLRRLRR
ncbi:hypothetical protein [Halomonas sp. M4R1S46]|uniref:hypothetical protein n=1 Tax=Halomonas sp. M4R1S46 TaxID=2982692 RepID=UPI0021E4078E|nr:hypothetical protein [Halomonas sp. M4R1S46]UYG06011.1 hypothetical protein OCT48_10120 [Halomonas sp. M4R1S46]